MNLEISGGTEPDFGNLNPIDVENLEQEELINDNTIDQEEEEEGSTVEESEPLNVNIADQDEHIGDTRENKDEPTDAASEKQDEPFNDKIMNQGEFSMTLEKDDFDKNNIEPYILVNDTRTQQDESLNLELMKQIMIFENNLFDKPFINKTLEKEQFIDNYLDEENLFNDIKEQEESGDNNSELIQPHDDQVLKPEVHLSQEEASNTLKVEAFNEEDVKAEEQIIDNMTKESFSSEMNVKQGFTIDKNNLYDEEPVKAEITIDKTKPNLETLDIEMIPEPEKLINSQTSKIHLTPDASQELISPDGSEKRLSQISNISFPERLQLPSQALFRNDNFSKTLERLSNQSFTTSDGIFSNKSNMVNIDSSDSFPGLLGSFGEEAAFSNNVDHVELINRESSKDEFGISEQEVFPDPSQAKLNNLTLKLVEDNTQSESGERNFSDPANIKLPIKEKSTILNQESESMKNLNLEIPNLDYLNLFQFIFNRPTFQNFDINMPGSKSNKDIENIGSFAVNKSVLEKLEIRETTQPFPIDLIHPEINPFKINQPSDTKQSSGNNRFIRGENKKSELNQEPQIIKAIQIPTQSQRKHSIQLGSLNPALGRGIFSLIYNYPVVVYAFKTSGRLHIKGFKTICNI